MHPLKLSALRALCTPPIWLLLLVIAFVFCCSSLFTVCLFSYPHYHRIIIFYFLKRIKTDSFLPSCVCNNKHSFCKHLILFLADFSFFILFVFVCRYAPRILLHFKFLVENELVIDIVFFLFRIACAGIWQKEKSNEES